MALQWIKTTRQLGQAVKNAGRLRQVLGVFSKYGFADLINRSKMGVFLPRGFVSSTKEISNQTPAERLRHAFEELGPTFVKLGQLLSTRSDILPENFIDEFKKLQDDVQPVSFDLIKKVLEQELGGPIEKRFSTMSITPLASASIGQVHEATLITGERVVVKVQRPDIEKVIQNDISLLAFIAKALERYVPEIRVFNPSVIVDEFFRSLVFELDYKIEANNMKKISENLASFDDVVVPRVYKELTTTRVLTQEKLEGIRVNDLIARSYEGIDKKEIVKLGARAFLKSVMIDGLFHGDLHGGNLFILPGNKLGVIDFGIVGRLSMKARDQLANMVMALITEDYEALCYLYAEMGSVTASVDFDAFQRDIRNTLSPYLGMSIDEVNTGRVLIEATRIATKYNISVPGDWMLVFKAIVTMEGMGRSLDPEFDFIAMGQESMGDIIKSQYSLDRIKKEWVWVGRDLVSLAQTLPRQLKWMFKKFNSDDFAFEIKIPEIKGLRSQLAKNNKKTVLAILSVGFLLSAAINVQHAALFAQTGMLPVHLIFAAVSVVLGVLAIL